jgi:hypothetical protein
MRASETFSDGLPEQYIIPKQKNLLYSYSLQEKVNFSNPRGTIVEATSLGRFLDIYIYRGENSPLNLWTLVVEDYSSTQLTYATYRLVAISALAETFAHHHNDEYLGSFTGSPLENSLSGLSRETKVSAKEIEPSTLIYLAGLWPNQLLEQLLWRVKSHLYTTTHSPTSYIAPSWSWASVTSPIDYSPIRKPRCNLSPLSKLLSASTAPSSTPFGAVTAGSIKILGPMFKAHLEPTTYWSTFKHYSVHLHFGSCKDHFYALLDDERSIAQSKVFCLPLFLSRYRIPSNLEMEGLLLIPTLAGMYRRVGIFSGSPMHYETLFREIRKAQKAKRLKSGGERIVALKELWRDVEKFAEGDGYKKLDVGIFEVEIV